MHTFLVKIVSVHFEWKRIRYGNIYCLVLRLQQVSFKEIPIRTTSSGILCKLRDIYSLHVAAAGILLQMESSQLEN
jgi:hypothetical protein